MKIIPQLQGDAGVYQTVFNMRRLINNASINPLIRKQAYLAIKGCNRTDDVCKAYSILAFAKSKINYISDPSTFELLQDPQLFAKAIEKGLIPYGDCDDFSMYIASLLKSIGLKPKLKVISTGIQYHHVYVMLKNIMLDGTVDHIKEMPNTRSFQVVI